MTLSEIQLRFLNALYAETRVFPLDQWTDALALSQNGSSKTGLKVYRKNLVFGLCGALEKTYPFCRYLIGEKNFKFLGREYIYAHPSKSSDIIEYGGLFPDFLTSRQEIRDFPFLHEIAKLEWARERVFYGKHSATLIRTEYKIFDAYRVFLDKGPEAVTSNAFELGVEQIAVSSKNGYPEMELEPIGDCE